MPPTNPLDMIQKAEVSISLFLSANEAMGEISKRIVDEVELHLDTIEEAIGMLRKNSHG